MDISVDVIKQRLSCGPIDTLCAIGVGGFKPFDEKCENDGATPLGQYPLRYGFYRPDRVKQPQSGLPFTPLSPDDGWCDTVEDINYNRHVTHPYPSSAERLWRDDAAYDLIIVIGHNDDPVIKTGEAQYFCTWQDLLMTAPNHAPHGGVSPLQSPFF